MTFIVDERIRADRNVSVVISGYSEDRWQNLVAAVESVRLQNVPPCEIIIVIDHNQRLLERARASLADAVVVENREQRGLSGARNSGVKAARGDVIAFMDDDAVADPTWLEWLTAAYTDSEVLGVGGGVEPVWAGGRPAWFPEEFDWVVGCTFRGMPEVPRAVRSLVGCNMSFRRAIFASLGGFRSGMGRLDATPLAGEETEFCIRAGQLWPRRRWVYEPRAKVYHTVPVRRAGARYFRSRCYAEGLSKILIARSVGAGDGLAAERTYTLQALPRGVGHGVTDAVVRRDPTGLARAAAIVAGLTITTAGYIRGMLARPNRSHPSDNGVLTTRY